MFSRQKTISLANFDGLWADSYLIVRMTGMQAILDMQVKVGKITKQLKKIDETDDSEENEINAVRLSQELIDTTISMITDRFISGMIYDDAVGVTRPLEVSEIREFDNEVLKYIIEEIKGSVPKG